PERPARAIDKANKPFFRKTPQPLVSLCPTNTKAATKLAFIGSRQSRQTHKFRSLIHDRSLPRHGCSIRKNISGQLSPMSPNRCHPCPRSTHKGRGGVRVPHITQDSGRASSRRRELARAPRSCIDPHLRLRVRAASPCTPSPTRGEGKAS